MSMMDQLRERAKKNKKTIILPESMDKRTFKAAQTILKDGLANLIIIGTPQEVEEYSKGFDITGATIIDPNTYEKTKEYEDLFVELRKSKGLTHEDARKQMLSDYTTYGCLMLKAGDADGLVSGACHSTANTLRPALQIIKTKPGAKLVSGFFVMEVPNCEFGENGVFVFADCSIEQNPDPEKLASIALSSAESFKFLVGAEPRVAMLSHSSKGSAKHDDVTKVVEATRIAKELAPDLCLDGELQLDAALVPEVGESKAPGSKVAGHANVFIFPDLQSGNIGYKIAQRLGGFEAIGPILQGLNKPISDLSRGCNEEDVYKLAVITAAQSLK